MRTPPRAYRSDRPELKLLKGVSCVHFVQINDPLQKSNDISSSRLLKVVHTVTLVEVRHVALQETGKDSLLTFCVSLWDNLTCSVLLALCPCAQDFRYA